MEFLVDATRADWPGETPPFSTDPPAEETPFR